jgi:hypothetical protein
MPQSAYEATYRASMRAAWDLDSVLQLAEELDFSRNFLPESLARTRELSALSAEQQRLLNQISAHEYLSLFILVEEFILPFLLDHARNVAASDDYAMRALLNFAGEEVKHMQLFRRFLDAFERGFPIRCETIGPSDAIDALEKVSGKPLPDRAGIADQQLQATRWTYLGSGMTHRNFLGLVTRVAPACAQRFEDAGAAFH